MLGQVVFPVLSFFLSHWVILTVGLFHEGVWATLNDVCIVPLWCRKMVYHAVVGSPCCVLHCCRILVVVYLLFGSMHNEYSITFTWGGGGGSGGI